MAIDANTLTALADALARVDAQVAAVGAQGEQIAARLQDLATRMQSAFALLAATPADDVEADALRAELDAAAHVMTTLATRCLLDLARAGHILAEGAEPLVTPPSPRPTTYHA
jgi:hypothetical protein